MKLHFKALATHFGAEVVGLNPDLIADSSVRTELNSAFEKYRLLLFRDVDFDSKAQARFGEVFGTHAPQPLTPEALDSHEANTQYVSNTRSYGMLPTGELTYHHDHLFDPEPLRAVMLYGVEVPSAGGATKFRSGDDTYRRLDQTTRALAETVRCLHLFDFYKGPINTLVIEKQVSFSLDSAAPGSPRTWQPLIWRDPRGGDPTVWVNYGTTVGFEGASFEAGQQLLSNILDCAAGNEEYVHQWRVGDAVIWNNRHLQHARIPFNSSEHRTLRRTTLM